MMKGSKVSFGKKLKALRARAGLSQRELGEKAGVNPISIGQWETGFCRPSGDKGEKLIRFLEAEVLAVAKGVPEAKVGKAPRISKRKIEKARREFYKTEVEPMVKEIQASSLLLAHDPAKAIRFGKVSQDWLEQQVDTLGREHAMVFCDAQVRLVVIRQQDLVAGVKRILMSCGTVVDGAGQ